jgi:hypothetical protein
MDKKVLKMYETPSVEVVELEVEGFLCASTNAENADVEDLSEELEE